MLVLLIYTSHFISVCKIFNIFEEIEKILKVHFNTYFSHTLKDI